MAKSPDKTIHLPDAKRPGEALIDLAQVFANRNATYGDNWESAGAFLKTLFPEGVKLSSLDDFVRIGVLVQVAAKLTRYAENWDKGGHTDSLNDLSVYAQILEYIDEQIRIRKAAGVPF